MPPLKTYTPEQLAEIVRLHGDWYYGRPDGVRADLSGSDLSGANLRGANLSGSDLSGANLRGANLSGADLRGSDLRGADLSGANLRGANLSGSDLSGANLRGANLSGADLRGSDLRDADLRGANLRGANLSDANLSDANLSDRTILSDGSVWKDYLAELVPALMQAGGKALAVVATETVWSCHSWGSDGEALGCPIATAFDVHTLSRVPILYRAQANLFIQLFDAGLIPRPVVEASV